jgi:hypothetical protein
MKKLGGFLVTCCFVPALYAGCMYYIATHRANGGTSHGRALTLAFLITLPVALCCLVQWWDVWVKTLPKLGMFWAPIPPSAFVTDLLLVHGSVAIVSICLQLATEQKVEFGMPKYDFVQARANLDKLNKKVEVASERLEPFRDKARDNFPYNAYQQDEWLNRFPEAIAFQNACKEQFEQKEEIEREEEKAQQAKPDPLFPMWPLGFGLLISVLTCPMQSKHYSGSRIGG